MTEREQIERLRDAVELTDREFMAEAADTIESLLAENERLRKERDLYKPDTSYLGHVCPACGRQYGLQARIEKLEAVLSAAKRIYNRDMHNQSDEDRLREAIAEAGE